MNRRRTLATFALGLAIGLAALAVGWRLGGPDGERGGPTPSAPPPPAPPATTAPQLPAAAADRAHGAGPKTEAASSRIAALREAVAQGGDADDRRRLAVALLDTEQYYPAYEVAEELLAADPDDVEALYVSAAVRVRMGQPSRALPLLDKVLAARPDHVGALVARGRALERAGHPDLAIDSWRRAIDAGADAAELTAMIERASGVE